MYVANGFKAAQRSKPKNDSPVSAGVGKMPSQTVTNKAELKALGERMGWTVRPLTAAEIRGGMSGQELIWHETFNAENCKRALELPAKIAEGKEVDKQVAARRIWEDRASPEETQAAIKEVEKFTSRHPSFIGARVENRKLLLDWLRERNLPVTYDNLAAAFADLATAGELVLSAACLGDNRELTGAVLQSYPRLYELIRPMPTAEQRMSAKDYYKSHPELHSKEIPFLVKKDNELAERTFIAMHPEYISTKNSHDKIAAQLQEWKLPVTVQSLEAAWKHLVEKGELQVDKSKVVQGQAVRITDLGGRR